MEKKQLIIHKKLKPPDFLSVLEEPPELSITKTKLKRPWKSVQLSESFYFRESTVKSTLHTFFKNKPSFILFIQDTVYSMNKLAFIIYHFVNFHVLYLLDNHLSILDLNQTFFEQVANLFTTDNGKFTTPESHFEKSFDSFTNILPSDFIFYDRKKSSHIINRMCSEMATATKNHLVIHFRDRFKSYLKLIHDTFEGDHIYFLISAIFDDEEITDNENLFKKYRTENNLQIIQYYQTLFKKPKNGDIDIMTNLDVFLPFYKTMLDKFLANNKKGFTILPEKQNFIPSSIKIDSDTLANMESLLHNDRTIDRAKIKNNPRYYWEKYTRFGNYETKNRIFHNLIDTNGYEVNIHMNIQIKPLPYPPDTSLEEKYRIMQALTVERQKKIEEREKLKKELDAEKKREAKKEQEKSKEKKETIKKQSYPMVIIENLENYKSIIGIDPGKRSLFTSYDNKQEILKCTGKEYHHLINHKKDLKKINARKDKIPEIAKLGEYSFKVTSSDLYLKNLKEVLKIINVIWKEYEKRFYRSIRFRKYELKKRAYEIICDRIAGKNSLKKETEPSKITIIGYGLGGSNGKGIKGSSMPIKGLYNKLEERKNVKIVGINENYTSQKCYNCKELLSDYKQWIVPKKSQKVNAETETMKFRSVYGLKCCKSTNSCINATYDRDENAAKNIYEILLVGSLSGNRPEYLRSKITQKPLNNRHCSDNVVLRLIENIERNKVSLFINPYTIMT